MREPPSRSYGFSLSRILSELAMMCLYGDLELQLAFVLRCDSALVPVLPAAPKASARAIVYGPLDRRSCTESIGELLCVVTRISAEHTSAMHMVSGPLPPAEHPDPDLRIACFKAEFGWCLPERPLARQRRIQMGLDG